MNKIKYAVSQLLRLPTEQKILIRKLLTDCGIAAELSGKSLPVLFLADFNACPHLSYKAKQACMNIYAKDCVKEAMDISNEAHIAFLKDKEWIDKTESEIKSVCAVKGWILEGVFWVKRVFKGSVCHVHKVLKGLHAESLEYVYISAPFNKETGEQLETEVVKHFKTLNELRGFLNA